MALRHIIVGTAGHIDHGKTALVKALTGTDTDRLEEEKRRGISIELGFAHLDLSADLRLGFVDVPGHERFVRNMLAGATGIDLALLVVAADESIKPQTREHFSICKLLNIRSGVVALTKSDLVGQDALELVQLEIAEMTAGSFLENAEVIPVSAVTGLGLAELRTALARAAGLLPERSVEGHARLPIDRSFSMKGFGTVVTGTLISGSICIEDELEVYPLNKRVRVRGIQVHGNTVERALAGERTAINLAGIEPGEAARGMTLAAPGLFRPVRQIDCAFDLLPGAQPLKHRAPVHLHAGTAAVEAEARLIVSLDPLQPGRSAHVRFLLQDPLLMLPGDRFIVRRFSPVVTIGGGRVVGIHTPKRMRRADLAERIRFLDSGTPEAVLQLMLQDSPGGASVADLVARTGMTAAAIRALANVAQQAEWIVDPSWAKDNTARLKATIESFHKKEPLKPGIPKAQLQSEVLQGAPAFLLDQLLKTPEIMVEGEVVRLATHKVAFQEDEQEAMARLEQIFEKAGLAVPPLKEALAQAGVDADKARTLLQILLRERRLLRISEEMVFHARAISTLRGMLASHRGQRFNVAEFKEWTGVSRKYAIPLLEYLDRERLTRREGDIRAVL